MKTIVWDYNGTIIDDVQLCYEIENEMMKERGMKPLSNIDEYKDLFCFPVINYYKKVGYSFDKESYAQLSAIFHQRYLERFDSLSLCEGFLECINLSKEKGYHNVILSAARHDLLVDQCKQLKIDSYFDEILGVDDLLASSKTSIANAWMHQSQINPEDCLFIGDTLHDYDVAKSIGIYDIYLVSSGHQSYEVLSKQHDHVYHSLKEIVL